MQLKNILNRVQKFKSFVNSNARWTGNALLFLYLLRSPEHSIVLAAAVFVIMLAIKRFERAGFILLLNRSKEQITHTTGGTDNGNSSAPSKAGSRSSAKVPLPGKG